MGILKFIKKVFLCKLNDEKISDTATTVSENEKVVENKSWRKEIFSGYFEGHYTRIIARV